MKRILIDYVIEATLKYLHTMPKEKRKLIGQFFTSAETARYMATMFNKPRKNELRILDPGAGSGILSAAIIDRLQEDTTIERIRLTCYETSEDILPLLKDNLLYMKENSLIPLDYEIIEENYITSQAADFNQAMFASVNPIKYDWIIGNPPYMKIAKDSPEASAMPTVCYGAPNLYFLFASMSLFNLDKNGELVYIIPRSWTSGAYFKAFREYLLSEGTLRHVHLFVSRDEVFENETVLQETMIIKVDKSNSRDKAQQGDLCCYSLLAMAGITADTDWADASNNWIRIHDIMQFISTAALIGIILGIKNRDTIEALWKSLSRAIEKSPTKTLEVSQTTIEKIAQSSVTVTDVIHPTEIPVISVTRTFQNPFEVSDHIRNLHEGWRASAEKIVEAEAMGIILQPGQTLVDAYMKGGVAA